MKCPICSARLLPGSGRCPDCGYLCRTVRTAPMPVQSAPNRTCTPSGIHTPSGSYTPPKKGRGCCFPVVIIAMVLLLLVTVTGSMFAVIHTAVNESVIYPPMSGTADEGCFSYDTVQGLLFLPDRWDGGPVLEVPETIGGEPVCIIGPGCFENCAELTTIILPDTVTVIGAEAFAGCTNLRGLFVPEGTELIDTGAFLDCTSMEAIHIPSSVEAIGPGAFDNCASLVYLFYNGPYGQWREICNEFINPFTTAICTDGNFYHGVQD